MTATGRNACRSCSPSRGKTRRKAAVVARGQGRRPTSPEVLVLQHVECETPGLILDVLKTKNARVRTIRSFRGEEMPTGTDGLAGLVVMGGPMGVYERRRYPFLLKELRLIEAALEEGRPILGVCLGSQLLAAALGAEVRPGPSKEIGWYDVTLTEAGRADKLWAGVPATFTALHWHGDVFDLPAGAEWLASSARTPHQAFRHGRNAYGLLFHLEVTPPLVRDWAATFEEELAREQISPEAVVKDAARHLPRLRTIGRSVFRAWVNLLEEDHA